MGLMGLGVGGALVGLGVPSTVAQWANSTDQLSSFRVVRFGRAALAVSGALLECSWYGLHICVFELGGHLHAASSRSSL